MNRRDFVKALAGIPLLGLLVKLPKVAEPTLAETYIKDVVSAESQPITLIIGDASHAGKGSLSIGSVERPMGLPEGDFWYVGDKEPYLPTDTTRKIIFYDPSVGDDANDGNSAETPVGSFQKALALAKRPGDWVYTIFQDENGDVYRDLEIS